MPIQVSQQKTLAMTRRLVTAGLLVASATAGFADGTPAVDFRRDVLPIFRSHCFECHDHRKQTASYRLDIREQAIRGGESEEVGIVPGRSEQSSIIQRVTSDDDDLAMPPEGQRLSAKQVEILRRWVDQGATWPDELSGEDERVHWAFRAPTRPALPVVEARHANWIRNPIDRFVVARLDHENLPPSSPCDRVTLIRRLSLDLIGLPPSPVEIDDFLSETSPGACQAVVERLLRSPHYGERWGRIWLDAARYADSDGYEKDKSRQVWFYRDWVIDALNRDLPYDRFIIEQLAGDQLPGATQDQIVATGFLRNSMINEEGGVHPEQFRMEAMFDRMDAIGKSMLGLTIQCGQCHDHKYDPLTQEEYYQLFAFLNNDHEANIAVYTAAEQMQRAELFRQICEVESELRHRHPDWAERMAAWEEKVQRDQPEWIVVQPEVDDISTGGQKYLPQPDGSLLAQSYAPTKHTVKLTVKTDVKDITGFRLELMNDPNLPLGGPGRSIWGTAALTEFSVEAAPANAESESSGVKISRATADLNLPDRPLAAIFDDRSKQKRVTGPVEFAIDGKEETAWGTDAGPVRRNLPRKAVFACEQPIAHDSGTVLVFYLKQNHGGWNSDDNQSHNLGRFRLSITTAPKPVADPLPKRVREILSIPREQRTAAQVDTVFRHWRTTVTEWKQANDQIEALWQQHPEGTSQLVLQSRHEPRETSLLRRGDFLKPVRPVTPATPAFLHPLDEEAEPSRLTFARWLVDRQSPTVARSIVNRVWQAYFGTGLVATSEDLGTRCEPPSHPQLLDWLAVEFMDSGWSLKALHRLIVNSATYQQSSHIPPALYERDPYNRLLARGPRFRVDAEIVRDIALSASGLLNPQVGGPSVYPPLPAFMLQPPVSYGPKVWYEAEGPQRYRRALYTFRYRSVPYPALEAFDAPNGDFSCVRRARSNTPLQALTTLNEPMFFECARQLARLTLTDGGTETQERLCFAFRRCLGRSPTDEEFAELRKLLEQQLEHQQLEHDDLASAGQRQIADADVDVSDGVAAGQLAAWTAVTRVLLNLDETITKE